MTDVMLTMLTLLALFPHHNLIYIGTEKAGQPIFLLKFCVNKKCA